MNAQVGVLIGFLFTFLGSFQVKTILGLIVLDLLLGVASALKQKDFEWQLVADFYLTNVIPYIVGYGALWLAISVIIPPSASLLSDALITMAWGVLVAALLGSVFSNLRELYPSSGAGGFPFSPGVPIGQTPPSSKAGNLPLQPVIVAPFTGSNGFRVDNGPLNTSAGPWNLESWRPWSGEPIHISDGQSPSSGSGG